MFGLMQELRDNPVVNFDQGMANWAAYYFPTPELKLEKGVLEDFLDFAVEKLTVPATKQRLCDILNASYLAHANDGPAFSSGVPASVFDSEYFMKQGSIGKNRGPLYSKGDWNGRGETPNITFSNVRSKNIKNLIAPISIFPNGYRNQGDKTKLYILHGFFGPITSEEAMSFAKWSNSISNSIRDSVIKEYAKIFNEFLYTPRLVKQECGVTLNLQDGRRIDLKFDGDVTPEQFKKELNKYLPADSNSKK